MQQGTGDIAHEVVTLLYTTFMHVADQYAWRVVSHIQLNAKPVQVNRVQRFFFLLLQGRW